MTDKINVDQKSIFFDKSDFKSVSAGGGGGLNTEI